MVSLGGAVGLIEAGRARRLGLSGPIYIVDQQSRDYTLQHTLALRNELTFTNGNPALTPEEIETYLSSSPAPIMHIQTTLPKTVEELRVLLGIDNKNEKVKIIFDQRATALYLTGQDMLDSIRVSLELLDSEGIYFLTRAYANRVFVDFVIRKDNDEVSRAELVHHSNSFFAQGTSLVEGTLSPRRRALFVEGTMRKDTGNNTLIFQSERESENLTRQHILQTIETIGEIFMRQYPYIIFDPLDAASFSNFLAYAYALTQENPMLFVPHNLPTKMLPFYEEAIKQLAYVISIYQKDPTLLENQNFSIPEAPGFSYVAITISSFFKKVEENPSILEEPLKLLKQLYESTPLVAVPPATTLLYHPTTSMLPPDIPLLAQEAMLNRFRKKFSQKFDHAFMDPIEGIIYTELVIDAILEMAGFDIGVKRWISGKEILGEDLEDYHRILQAIQKKILAAGKDKNSQALNLSEIKNRKSFYSSLLCLPQVRDNIWQEVMDFIGTHLQMRSLQGA